MDFINSITPALLQKLFKLQEFDPFFLGQLVGILQIKVNSAQLSCSWTELAKNVILMIIVISFTSFLPPCSKGCDRLPISILSEDSLPALYSGSIYRLMKI